MVSIDNNEDMVDLLPDHIVYNYLNIHDIYMNYELQ